MTQEEREAMQQEIFDNAQAINGDNFANCAAAYFELSQVQAILTVLAKSKVLAKTRKDLFTMASELIGSVSTKIFQEISEEKRLEANNIARRMLRAVTDGETLSE